MMYSYVLSVVMYSYVLSVGLVGDNASETQKFGGTGKQQK